MTLLWQLLIGGIVIAFAIEAAVLIALMRQVGTLSLQLNPMKHLGEVEGGPEVGTLVDFPGLDTTRPTVVTFVSPDCRVCEPLIGAFKIVARNFGEAQVIAAIIGSDPESRAQHAGRIGQTARIDLQGLESAWNITGTPFAVGLERGGRVHASGVANTLDNLERLLESVITASEHEAELVDIEPNGDSDYRVPAQALRGTID